MDCYKLTKAKIAAKIGMNAVREMIVERSILKDH